jgi:hypothetical protein
MGSISISQSLSLSSSPLTDLETRSRDGPATVWLPTLAPGFDVGASLDIPDDDPTTGSRVFESDTGKESSMRRRSGESEAGARVEDEGSGGEEEGDGEETG